MSCRVRTRYQCQIMCVCVEIITNIIMSTGLANSSPGTSDSLDNADDLKQGFQMFSCNTQ